MAGIARDLAAWAHAVTPMPDDFELAERSLVDTVAVALAARAEPLVLATGPLGDAGRWATAAHVLDFDDVHVESTSHISALIVPVVLACGGGAREYLAGAGVMARLGSALGWEHYLLGWHATCTAGAPASAVAAAVALGLDPVATAHAMALAIPAAGGVQRAFGTDAKALQVGFAADAGVRAARLASAGARGDLSVVEQWLELMGASALSLDDTDVIVPGGLAIKLFPCCYAMQRPISAVREFVSDVTASEVDRVVVTTPAGTVKPLIHHRPTTGLEGKFSMEYAIATAMLDGFPTLDCFTDASVSRPAAQSLLTRVETHPEVVPLTVELRWPLVGDHMHGLARRSLICWASRSASCRRRPMAMTTLRLPRWSWTIHALSGLRPRLLAEPMVTSATAGGVLWRWRWAAARQAGEQYRAGRPVTAGVIGFSQSGAAHMATVAGVSLRNERIIGVSPTGQLAAASWRRSMVAVRAAASESSCR